MRGNGAWEVGSGGARRTAQLQVVVQGPRLRRALEGAFVRLLRPLYIAWYCVPGEHH